MRSSRLVGDTNTSATGTFLSQTCTPLTSRSTKRPFQALLGHRAPFVIPYPVRDSDGEQIIATNLDRFFDERGTFGRFGNQREALVGVCVDPGKDDQDIQAHSEEPGGDVGADDIGGGGGSLTPLSTSD